MDHSYMTGGNAEYIVILENFWQSVAGWMMTLKGVPDLNLSRSLEKVSRPYMTKEILKINAELVFEMESKDLGYPVGAM